MAETLAYDESETDRGKAGEGAGARFDVIVVGAGSAGFSAAITAVEQGARVALIGHGTIGGTCVNIGCVPSKTFIRAAEAVHGARAASRFAGIRGSAALEDWGALREQKNALVAGLRKAKYVDLIDAYEGLTYIEGRARLTQGGVLLADGRALSSERIIITTGARPALPDIAGIEDVPVLTSTDALDLARLPRSLLVLGGGYIGAELAQMFARLGVAVTLVFRSRLLPTMEPEIGAALTDYLRQEGLAIEGGLAYRAIRRTEAGIALDITQDGLERTLEAEQVLVATGRRPNTEGLGLDALGVARTPDGGIRVDGHMRTSRPGIWAAGDVTGRDAFVYMAAYGARIAALDALASEGAAQAQPPAYDNSAMPSVVFTDPQAASVGLTEAEAVAAGHEVATSVIGLEHVPRALAAHDARGLIKLVADRRTDRLLGAHILAPEGADSIQTAALAIAQGLTVAALGAAIFPYLTTVEGLKLAAQAFHKDVARLSCCAG